MSQIGKINTTDETDHRSGASDDFKSQDTNQTAIGLDSMPMRQADQSQRMVFAEVPVQPPTTKDIEQCAQIAKRSAASNNAGKRNRNGKEQCLFPRCEYSHRAGNKLTRGLCAKHRAIAGKLIKDGRVTEEQLMRSGKLLLRKKTCPCKDWTDVENWFLTEGLK